MDKMMKVWWIPQVPMKKFEVDVNSVQEAAKILTVLADYDLFQYENNIKPDYCNAGGLSVWNEEDQDWEDWYSEDGEYDCPIQYCQEKGIK